MWPIELCYRRQWPWSTSWLFQLFLSEDKCSIFFRYLLESPCDLTKYDIPDDLTSAFKVISDGFIVSQKQEVKVIWQKAPHGGPIPRLGVTPGGRKLYHWIPGVGFPISVP